MVPFLCCTTIVKIRKGDPRDWGLMNTPSLTNTLIVMLTAPSSMVDQIAVTVVWKCLSSCFGLDGKNLYQSQPEVWQMKSEVNHIPNNTCQLKASFILIWPSWKKVVWITAWTACSKQSHKCTVSWTACVSGKHPAAFLLQPLWEDPVAQPGMYRPHLP